MSALALRLGRERPWLVVVLAAAFAAATGALFALSPWYGVAFAAALGATAISLWRPDFAVLFVLFVLYSNLPAVGVAYHGVPKLVAGAFPLLLLIPLGRDLWVRGAPLVLTPTFALLVLLLAVQAAGVIFASDGPSALAAAVSFATEGLLLYLLVVNVVRTPQTLRGAIWALVAAGALMSVMPLYQQATHTFDDTYGGLAQVDNGEGFKTDGPSSGEGGPRQMRLAGPIGEKNRFSQVLLVLLPLALLRCSRARRPLERNLAVLSTLLITFGFALAFSRGGAVGLACLVAAMVCLRTIDSRKALLLAAAVGLALVAVPQYLQRLKTMGTAAVALEEDARSADSSVRRRLTVMFAAVQMFLDHPLIGVGPGMFLEHSEEYGNQNALRRLHWGRRAHCLYLEVAAENGALGLGLFLTAVAVTARRLARARRESAGSDPELADTCTGFLLALIAYLATALFLHLSYVRYFYLLLGMCDAAANVALARRSASAAVASRPALVPMGTPA
jgi:hypothetical protein